MNSPIIPSEKPNTQGNSSVFSIEELKQLPVWLASNPDKKPISAVTGNVAKWSNPKELTTFDKIEEFISGREGFLPAFVLYKEQGIVFIDLDHCYKEEALTPLAQTLLSQTANSFAEKSRSGNGLHILVKGAMKLDGIKTSDIEIYSAKKIVTLTFDHIDGRTALEDYQHLIDTLIKERASDSRNDDQNQEDADPIMTNEEVINKVKASSHHKILFEGGFNVELQKHYKEDHSSADFALMCQISKYTRNQQQAIEVFTASSLWSDERDRKKGGERYLNATFHKAKSKTALEPEGPETGEIPESRKVPLTPYFFIDTNSHDGKNWVFAQPAIDEKSLNYILIGSSREELSQMAYDILKTKFEGDAEAVLPEPLPICSEIHKSSVIINQDKNQHCLMVSFPTYEDGHQQQLSIPTGDLHTDPNSIINLLCSRGLYIKHGLSKHVIGYLNTYRPEDKGLLTDKIGWHGDTYILPDQHFGTRKNIFVDDRQLTQSEHLHSRGSLKEWQEHIGKYLVGNPALIFGVGMAFAPVLMNDLKIESGGIHFFGNSSTGKTTMVTIANSVWAAPKWKNTWRSTDNGLEGLCCSHNDAFMVLDEIGQCTPEVVGKSVYMIANETAKLRANRKGDLKEIRNWRTLFASDGEISVEQMILEYTNKVKAGQLVRLLDVPLQFQDAITTDDGTPSVYHDLHGFKDITEFSKHFHTQTAKYYGSPIREFLQCYSSSRSSEALEELRKQYQSAVNKLEEYCTENHGSCSAQVKRGIERFALVLLALLLVAENGLLSIDGNDCIESVTKIFDLWIKGRGTTASLENKQILEKVKLFIDRYAQTSKFIDYDSEMGSVNHSEILGFQKKFGDETEWYLSPEVFKNVLCREIGSDVKKIVEVLKRERILKTEEGRSTITAAPKSLGKNGRFYVLTDEILNNLFDDPNNRYSTTTPVINKPLEDK
ncbi:MAG: putative DNA primase/helicase [Chlamydiales bacterium]|jgi:putative DNA primase/helicase